MLEAALLVAVFIVVGWLTYQLVTAIREEYFPNKD